MLHVNNRISPHFTLFRNSCLLPALALGLGVLFHTATLSAATIVNWDGGTGGQAYLGPAPVSQNLAGGLTTADITYAGAAATDRQQIRTFSSSSALSPAGGYPNGVDTTQYSTTFYGGYESIVLDASSGAAISAMVVRTGTPASTPDGSVIRLTDTRPAASQYVVTSIVMFNKADFLGGLNAGALTLNSLSMTLLAPPASSGSFSNMRGRWLVANGGTYYLSQNTFSLDAGTRTINDFTSTLWATFTPSTVAGTVLNFQPSSFAMVDFNDVQSVGYYAETWNSTNNNQFLTGTGGTNSGYNLTDFSAVAVPVPEPSPVLILGVCALSVTGVRRWKVRP